MINSENSELKQTVWGNIPPNAYFAEEKHVQMFSGACTHHISKAIMHLSLANLGHPPGFCFQDQIKTH